MFSNSNITKPFLWQWNQSLWLKMNLWALEREVWREIQQYNVSPLQGVDKWLTALLPKETGTLWETWDFSGATLSRVHTKTHASQRGQEWQNREMIPPKRALIKQFTHNLRIMNTPERHSVIKYILPFKGGRFGSHKAVMGIKEDWKIAGQSSGPLYSCLHPWHIAPEGQNLLYGPGSCDAHSIFSHVSTSPAYCL